MIGVEPAADRMEIYFRLPNAQPDDLYPVLAAAGYPHALSSLQHRLPDGTRRLAGRRLGISFANASSDAIEVSLFVTARSLFPGAPELIRKLIPSLPVFPDFVCPTIVTMRLTVANADVSFAVGVTARLTKHYG
jgi:hypothetical protein